MSHPLGDFLFNIKIYLREKKLSKKNRRLSKFLDKTKLSERWLSSYGNAEGKLQSKD